MQGRGPPLRQVVPDGSWTGAKRWRENLDGSHDRHGRAETKPLIRIIAYTVVSPLLAGPVDHLVGPPGNRDPRTVIRIPRSHAVVDSTEHVDLERRRELGPAAGVAERYRPVPGSRGSRKGMIGRVNVRGRAACCRLDGVYPAGRQLQPKLDPRAALKIPRKLREADGLSVGRDRRRELLHQAGVLPDRQSGGKSRWIGLRFRRGKPRAQHDDPQHQHRGNRGEVEKRPASRFRGPFG